MGFDNVTRFIYIVVETLDTHRWMRVDSTVAGIEAEQNELARINSCVCGSEADTGS